MVKDSIDKDKKDYEIWALPNIGDAKHLVRRKEEEVKPPTVEEIEAMRRDAYKEAFSEGKRDGEKNGYEIGFKKGEKDVKQKLSTLNKIINILKVPLDNQDSEIEQEVLNIAFSVAESIVQRELSVNREHIVDIVKEAISNLPIGDDYIDIYVNPKDVGLIQEASEQHNTPDGLSIDKTSKTPWNILSDKKMNAGGCRIETKQSVIDYSVEQRIKIKCDEVLNKISHDAKHIVPESGHENGD